MNETIKAFLQALAKLVEEAGDDPSQTITLMNEAMSEKDTENLETLSGWFEDEEEEEV